MTQKSRPERNQARLRRAITRGDHAKALAEVNLLLERSPDQPQLLVTRAELIQLQGDEDGSPTLEDAKEDLLKAVALDESSPNALIELGHFLFSVEDDPAQASKCFQKAISLGRTLLERALIGQAEVLHEQGHDDRAMACLAEAHLLRKSDKEGDRLLLERTRSVLQSN